MADGLNKVMLIGNLGQDPELRVTQGGQSLLNMSIACSESYLDKNRVRQEKTEWVKCVIWGKRAEALSKFLSKGDKVFVEGKLSTNKYEDKECVTRYSTQVVAFNLIIHNSARARNAPDDPDRQRPNRRQHHEEDKGGGGGGYDDQDYGSGRPGNGGR